jgi:hypothetical protein
MVSYRTSLNDFMLDQLDFIECKLREAIDDAASQKGAIIEASGVVPQIKERLWFEDEGRAVSCLLVFPSLVERGGENWWNDLANMGRDQFVREAKGLFLARERAGRKSGAVLPGPTPHTAPVFWPGHASRGSNCYQLPDRTVPDLGPLRPMTFDHEARQQKLA